MKPTGLTAFALATALVVAGCGNGSLAPAPGDDAADRIDPDEGGGGLGGQDGGLISDIPGLIGDDPNVGGGLTPVNRHLWRASLDTLAFLPLASTDPFTGVVATDWAASPDAPNERFKVTSYVTGPVLSAQTLQVAVFREIRNPAGGWNTAPVSGVTARQLEDAILVRARQLKIREREQG